MTKPTPTTDYQKRVQNLPLSHLIQHQGIIAQWNLLNDLMTTMLDTINHPENNHPEDIVNAIYDLIQVKVMTLEAEDIVLEAATGVKAIPETDEDLQQRNRAS